MSRVRPRTSSDFQLGMTILMSIQIRLKKIRSTLPRLLEDYGWMYWENCYFGFSTSAVGEMEGG